MKKNNITFVLLTCLALTAFAFSQSKNSFTSKSKHNEIEAGLPVFFSWGGEKISKVIDFPDIDELKNPNENKYVDAGIRYKQVTIFFMPVWNYDVTWCGYIDVDGKYLDMTHDELSKIAEQVHITLPSDPEDSISFWNKYGGKIIITILLAIYILFKIESNKTKA